MGVGHLGPDMQVPQTGRIYCLFVQVWVVEKLLWDVEKLLWARNYKKKVSYVPWKSCKLFGWNDYETCPLFLSPNISLFSIICKSQKQGPRCYENYIMKATASGKATLGSTGLIGILFF